MNRATSWNVSDRPAFTLVELLVVVSIIASLLAILLPALSGARDAARNVKCMANLRAINTGVAMYAGDHKDFAFVAWIRRRVFNGGPGGPTPAHYPDNRDTLVWHEGHLGQYSRSFNGINAWDLPDRNGVWKCPDDAFGINQDGTARPSYREAFRVVASGSGQFFPYIRSMEDYTTRMNKLSAAQFPSMLATLLDHGNVHQLTIRSWGQPPLYANPKEIPGTGFAQEEPGSGRNHHMRHPPNGRGTNMAFVDNSVRTITNTPSDIDGVYWLHDNYGTEFVFRPEDVQ